MAENKPKLDTIQKPPAKKAVSYDRSKPLISILTPLKNEPVGPAKPAKKKKSNIFFRELFDLGPNKKPKVVIPVDKKTKKPLIKKHRKEIAIFGLVLGVISLIALFVTGFAYASQSLFAYKVYPGVTVWGQNMGGKTVAEVEQLINNRVGKYKITLSGPGQTYTATAANLGLEFDSTDMALNAYAKGRSDSQITNLMTRFRLFGTSLNWSVLNNILQAKSLTVKPNYQVDQTVLNGYINQITSNVNITAKDSQLKISGGNTVLIPAIYGRQVNATALTSSLEAQVNQLSADPIKIATTTIPPSIIDAAAQAVMSQANTVMERPITLSYNGQTFTPDQQTVASWITFTKPNGAQNYTLTISPALMKSYFSFLASKINVYPTDQVIQVTNGTTQTVTKTGTNGLEIDQAALGQTIAADLPKESRVNINIPMVNVPFKIDYDNIVVADWAKYIDIDLSTQTMCAYLAGGVQQGCWAITSGRDSLPTPTGTFLILRKVYVTSMPNPPSPYPLNNIHYVSYFTNQGDAIHEAWWRSSFGGQDYHWDGSHGCINASLSVAEYIYNWAPIGTPVIVHY